jgi:hypothetical protein
MSSRHHLVPSAVPLSVPLAAPLAARRRLALVILCAASLMVILDGLIIRANVSPRNNMQVKP